MSVAFRRDNDDEHLEPRFERPIAPGPNLVTRSGLKAIDAQAARLAAAIAAAPDGPDADAMRRDLRYWQTRHATAEVVEPPVDGTIGIGSRVAYRLRGAERRVAIVGGDEADGRGAIAFTAPLARAMTGAEEGDLIDFAGEVGVIEILAVENEAFRTGASQNEAPG